MKTEARACASIQIPAAWARGKNMGRPIKVVAEGLAHPEGPDVLPDGTIIFVETFASDVKVYQEGRGVSRYGFCGGGPNACLVGSDGHVYVAQNGGNAGTWRADCQVAPSIQKICPDGKVEVVATDVDGLTLRSPKSLVFGADGRLYFTDPGEWDPVGMAGVNRIFALNPDGTGELIEEFEGAYPNGIAAERDGGLVWTETYSRTVRRRKPDGTKEVVAVLPDGHYPDGIRIDIDDNFWIATIFGGVFDVVSNSGSHVDAVEAPFAPLNCVFQGATLWVTDYGNALGSGADAAKAGRLIAIDVQREGMPVFRGAIG